MTSWVALLVVGTLQAAVFTVESVEIELSKERIVLQTDFGDIELALYPKVAPTTYVHMLKMFKLGGFNTNSFFRVDKGFVAQTSDVIGGRTVPLNPQQQEEANKNVPLEVVEGVKHHTGAISMARSNDPNSATTSFFVVLGDAPHLDMQYSVFGVVTKGMEALRKMETVETRKEGIFVMPKERITIHSTYWYTIDDSANGDAASLPDSGAGRIEGECIQELERLRRRSSAQDHELQSVRAKCLPGGRR